MVMSKYKKRLKKLNKKVFSKEPLILSRDTRHAFLSISRTLRPLNAKKQKFIRIIDKKF